MNAADLLASLCLPVSASVNQRVPKKLLVENGAPTTADKRQINEGIEELVWRAALKPNTIGVADFRDEVREYLEIAVLAMTLRHGSNVARLSELVHRAIPYPVVLTVAHPAGMILSLAHKRWSQGEKEKTVLDSEPIEVELEGAGAELDSFREALSLALQPRENLYTLYQGWINTLLAFKAARLTGSFVPPSGPAHATDRHDALKEHARLEAEIERVRSAAAKEKQLSRQVELNLELKHLRAAHADALARL